MVIATVKIQSLHIVKKDGSYKNEQQLIVSELLTFRHNSFVFKLY